MSCSLFALVSLLGSPPMFSFSGADLSSFTSFTDDYKNRAKAASVAKMRVESDMSYQDLGLVQPEGGSEVGELEIPGLW